MTHEQTTLQWLSEQQGIDLTNTNHQELAGFFMLWASFEKKYFQAADIKNISGSLEKLKAISNKMDADYSHLLCNMNEWYFNGKSQGFFFQQFSGQGNAYKKFFEDYLTREKHTPEEEKVFVLAIIYQYRCNAFHGSKNLGLAACRQKEKIRAYNQFLISCLE